MGLTPEEERIVQAAVRSGLLSDQAQPSYLPAWSCTVLSCLLALPSLGLSLLFVPILWVAQHDITAARIDRLRARLETHPNGQLAPNP